MMFRELKSPFEDPHLFTQNQSRSEVILEAANFSRIFKHSWKTTVTDENNIFECPPTL